jgi:DNA-directed RNA polymerase alpha subunit
MKIILEFDSINELNDFITKRINERSKRKIYRSPNIRNYNLSKRIITIFDRYNIKFVEEAFEMSNNKLLKLKNMGPKSLREITDLREKLENHEKNNCL